MTKKKTLKEAVEEYECEYERKVKGKQIQLVGCTITGRTGEQDVGVTVLGAAAITREEFIESGADGVDIHVDNDGKVIGNMRYSSAKPDISFERAHGDVLCSACDNPYWNHPDDEVCNWLKVLCDGTRVKL